jgi:hypothetical protein
VKITVRLVIDAQDGMPPAVEQVAAIAWDDLTMATAGLALAEAHEVLCGIQHHLVTAQAGAAAITGRHCGSCGRARPRKDTRHIVLRTLFGTLRGWRVHLRTRVTIVAAVPAAGHSERPNPTASSSPSAGST